MATIAETLFPLTKDASTGDVTQSAVTTPQVKAAAQEAAPAPAAVTQAVVPETPSTPPPFSADVPSSMDATTVAGSMSGPTALPPATETSVYRMADGRYYAPSTGKSGATREEALGQAPSGNAPAETKPSPETKPASTPVPSDLSSAFPESKTLQQQYDEASKAAGIPELQAKLDDVNSKIADFNAAVANIEEDVRSQAGGQADESFIKATIADRMRRLTPLANQLNAQQTALAGQLKTKQDALDLQMTLAEKDITLQRAAFDKTVNSLAAKANAGGADPSDEYFSKLDRANGFSQGVSKAAYELAKEDVAATKTSTDLDNFMKLSGVLSKMPPDQQITIGGKTYSGTMDVNEFKGYEIDKATGDLTAITYNTQTGKVSAVTQKGVLSPNVEYKIQSVDNADGSTSLWYVDPTGKNRAVPVLGMQNGGAQGVNLGVLQTAYPAGQKPAGTENGWCVQFINQLVSTPFAQGTLNTIDQKRAAVDASITTPQVGDLVFTNEDATYGHVALINSIRQDPSGKLVAVLTESNYGTDGQGNGVVGHTRTISLDSANLEKNGGVILGYKRVPLRPELGSQLVQLGDAATGSAFSFSDPAIQDAVTAVASNLPKAQGEIFQNGLRAAQQSGDASRVKSVLRSGVRSSLQATEQQAYDGRIQAVDALRSIQGDIAAYQKAGGNIGIFSGNAEKIINKLGTVKDPKLVALATKIAASLQVYRRSMTGVAFSPGEAKEYEKIFPSTTGSAALNDTKINALVDLFTTNNKSAVSSVIGPDVYDKIYGASLADQVRAAGYDYEAMRKDGNSDEDIKAALGIK